MNIGVVLCYKEEKKQNRRRQIEGCLEAQSKEEYNARDTKSVSSVWTETPPHLYYWISAWYIPSVCCESVFSHLRKNASNLKPNEYKLKVFSDAQNMDFSQNLK